MDHRESSLGRLVLVPISFTTAGPELVGPADLRAYAAVPRLTLSAS